MRIWKLDGEVVSFKKIINVAKEYGYEGYGGIFQTSVACTYLERNGHKVECTEAPENE